MKMGESEAPSSMCSLNTFMRQTAKHAGNYFNNETDGKKYKLRLKFDGSCVLEVVRLNGGHFQNLTHLDISGNSAEKLDLRSLNRLEWLCCANNNLEVLLLSGTSLTYLDCSYNNLLSISVDPVPNNLSTLQISFNNLDELPTWTWMVPELFIIYASHNRLRQLDCKFQNSLTNLPIRELHLHCNKIEFVSKDFITRANRLKILNLSKNQIEYMPNLGKRCPIQELFLSRNNLQDTDEKDSLDFLLECTHLRRLHLAFNRIEHISERCITVWKHLEELILCGNRIRSLPAKISSLSNLRVLRVHSNALETAPNLTKMSSLKVVDLSHNNLKKINLESLISGGNLTYLDISCNEHLSLTPEKLSTQNQRRPMNLVEVTHPRKRLGYQQQNRTHRDFPGNPPWEIGFSELPDRSQILSVSQYRDVNLSYGKEALFGIFDGGDGNPAPKYISKSIAKIYSEEKNIEESQCFSLKYTLLNAIKAIKQQGYSRPLQGILCLLSSYQDNVNPGKTSFYLNLAMVGGIKCLLVNAGNKITKLTDLSDVVVENQLQLKNDNEAQSFDGNSETSSTKSDNSENNLNSNIPDPKLITVPLTTSTEFLIIGNQSVWNFINEPELLEELEANRHKKSVLIAKRLTDMVQAHYCKQSISLIVVKFKWHINPPPNGMKSYKRGVGNRLSADSGPLSYNSGGSEYSDASNPLISVITPDSAIDTDRSSRTGSVGSNNGSTNSASTNISNNPKPRDAYKTSPSGINEYQNMSRYHSHKSNLKSSQSDRILDPNDGQEVEEDLESLANTTISQMSVEQFKCWEYMLEQNTRMLFKKELDTLSKGVFQRNQKQRKSVHFPYQTPGGFNSDAPTPKLNKTPQAQVSNKNKQTTPGFYTLSKAKSLSHLFGADASNKVAAEQINNNINKPSKSIFPKFNNNSVNNSPGFFGSVRSNAKRAILGGPNAAYFSSSQRQSHLPHECQESLEIQEVKNFDSIEHDSRLKRYWENKVTEL